ncbi:MFS transporter [Paraburkholderia terricola]|jgi:ACS family D-galactonate transporter-like MFS transporter|uniref:ACS family D-galactonate transporter-like MFS transporter n=1 Tax=Paraburkholderia terricola TaxID=169427 RepID=A0A1M6WWW1_9BURK|nr:MULTISPECIES: MFS transporter [Paraburkholderia]ORC45454.1 MFS transporter [Burkholderia sp. A27]MDR6411917.1 ACS family D-galactonate transporter-like MFS transporter [Paraburkholderia terricola]MDR6484485.1 ACS family D-galactonate transporter-like MFS transporter [Paraburkholderia terricola]SDP23189.1 MFS transporter, ACS family, D-galactonate transporter [Paraburkholderia sediminicola]SHK98131.1 MFS transporter, ACS family, D-galactonate transporter [Paraburkholderia terricola]
MSQPTQSSSANATLQTDAAVSTPRRSKARYQILALLAVGTMINYLDRTVLGIAAPQLTKELGINAALMGLLFSVFSWSYVASQIPGGLFLDRFGSKLTYFLSMTLWSLCTLAQGLVNGVGGLFAFRLGLGVSEAPCFPTNSRVVATWFPQSERAMATGTYTVGEYIGLAFFSPFLFMLMGAFGWRSLFLVVGGAGIVFGGIWWMFYREPRDHPSANQAELDYIEAGGGLTHRKKEAAASGAEPAAKTGFEWRTIGRLLKHRQLTGICLGQFAGNSTLVFFLTWFPTYLATERHMAWLKIGFFAIMPFIAASIGVMFGGLFSDWLLRRGKSANVARKLPIIAGLLLASTIILANYVESNVAVIAILSVAFFAQGMAALGWTLVSDIAPDGLLGVTGGIFNFAANLAGIITPLVVGFIVAATGSFVGALVFIGVIALIGALSYIFIVGDIKRIVLVH